MRCFVRYAVVSSFLFGLTVAGAAATIATLSVKMAQGRRLGAAAENELGVVLVYYSPSQRVVEVVFQRRDGTETRHTSNAAGRIDTPPVITQFEDGFVVAVASHGQGSAVDALALSRDGMTRAWTKQLFTVSDYIANLSVRAVGDRFVLTTQRAGKLEQREFARDGLLVGMPTTVVDQPRYIGVFDELLTADGEREFFWTSMFECRTLCMYTTIEFWAGRGSEASEPREVMGASFPYPHAATNRGVTWVASMAGTDERYRVELQKLDLSQDEPAFIGTPLPLHQYTNVLELLPFGAGFLLLASSPDENYTYTLEAIELSTSGVVGPATVVGDPYLHSHVQIDTNGGVIFDRVRNDGLTHDLTLLRPTHRRRQV